MNKTKSAVMKLMSLVFGVPILIVGIILIPLPGPGVLVTLLGLFILSRGFESVKRPLDTYRRRLVDIYHRAYERYDRFLEKHNLNDD